METKRTFIVGYGNPWRGDDGVGREVAIALWRQRGKVPVLAGATITWAHQLLPEMASDISESSLAVFIDAAYNDRPAGSIVCERLPAPVGWARGNLSFGSGCWEDLTPSRLLALALDLYGCSPPGLLVAVSVLGLELGRGMSPVTQDAVPRAAETVISALKHAQPTADAPAPLVRSQASGAPYA